MRNLMIYLSALAHLLPSRAMRHGSSQLEDLLAFPKYEVQFLNNLPLSKSDAARCQSAGLDKESQFLDLTIPLHTRKTLGDADHSDLEDEYDKPLSLIPMNLGTSQSAHGKESYLCLMPSANVTESQTSRTDASVEHEEEPDPLESWQALNHLDGQCLYMKHGWFTYSYCHNSHIRQFREARHPHPHPPGGYIPQEDPNYDAYTLGQAHSSSKKPKASLPPGHPHSNRQTSIDKTNPQSNTHTHTHGPSHPDKSVSFGSAESSRYLVQRWSDGTRCDKSGKPREVEIQVHCSMTTTDFIYLVKELAICQYVIVIHSPHLCSLPGFRAEHKDIESAPIKCRRVIEDEEMERWLREGKDGEDGVLRLPYESRPKGMEIERKALPPTFQLPIEEFVIQGTEDGDLKVMLEKALSLMQSQLKSHRDDKAEGEVGDQEGGLRAEDVVLLSWEEDENGQAILLEADLVGGDGSGDGNTPQEGEGTGRMGEIDKEVLLNVMREYLKKKAEESKDQSEDEERVRDEL